MAGKVFFSMSMSLDASGLGSDDRIQQSLHPLPSSRVIARWPSSA